jgi:hypothetical protein
MAASRLLEIEPWKSASAIKGQSGFAATPAAQRPRIRRFARARSPPVPVANTVHDLQIVGFVPRDPTDQPLSVIATPTRGSIKHPVRRANGHRLNVHQPRGPRGNADPGRPQTDDDIERMNSTKANVGITGRTAFGALPQLADEFEDRGRHRRVCGADRIVLRDVAVVAEHRIDRRVARGAPRRDNLFGLIAAGRSISVHETNCRIVSVAIDAMRARARVCASSLLK